MALIPGGRDLTKGLAPAIPIRTEQISDVVELKQWEYWLQLSFQSTDLHVKRAWRLQSAEEEAELEKLARALRGPVVFSWINFDELTQGRGGQTALRQEELRAEWRERVYTAGTTDPPKDAATT